LSSLPEQGLDIDRGPKEEGRFLFEREESLEVLFYP
jgi:hypothetical protein